MNATNPGQRFFNIFQAGTPGSTLAFTITIPYPYVTQGANPIHVYDGVTVYSSGGQSCFQPGNGIAVNSKQITLASYTNGTYQNSPDGNSVGTHTFTYSVTVPASGFVYFNMHLDYGLKGTSGYANLNNDAVSQANASLYLIPDLADHTFQVSGGQAGTSTIENINSFKKNPGVGGLSQLTTSQGPVANAKVTLRKGGTTGTIVGTGIRTRMAGTRSSTSTRARPPISLRSSATSPARLAGRRPRS